MSKIDYLPEHYRFEHHGSANPEAIVQGENYRFTLLSDCFIRMEYNEEGVFEDRPSQVIWHRDLEVPVFTLEEVDGLLTIRTDKIVLKYEMGAPFSRSSLMIKAVTAVNHGTGVYRYGFEPLGNLGGTYRTLDEADGAVPLDDGLFTDEGYSIIDDGKSLVFNEDGWFETRDQGVVDVYYFGYGSDYIRGLEDFYKVSGKTPLLPRYALGNWWSRYWEYSDTELDDLLNTFAEKNIPLSVCIIDMDWHKVHIHEKYGHGWTGYSWNKELFKDPKAYIESLHARGIRTALNLHPALGIRGHEDCYEEFGRFMGVDVANEEMIAFDPVDPKFMDGYFRYAHHPHEAMGVDFWWMDWQQGNNTKMEGVDPLYLLNHYHFMDHGRKEERRPFNFSRWSGLGSHRYPIGFSGDTVVSWASLRFQPEFTMTAANVGYGWWSHDIGGHMEGLEDDELYIRWIQYGVFSPIMRLHTTKNYYSKREPWRHGIEAEQIATDYMQLRHELLPYLYAMNKYHAEGGMPLVTPMAYHYPGNHKAGTLKDQYMFGTELMVAPFVAPMDEKLLASKRQVWFPQGTWFDWTTGERFTGEGTILVYGDLSHIPAYAKAGAIIPRGLLTYEEDGITLKQGVDLPDTMVIDIFPGEDNRFEIYEDDGVSNAYKQGQWVKTIVTTTYLDEKQLKLTIDVEGDKSLLPDKREIVVRLRSFNMPMVQEGYKVIEDGDENAIEIWKEMPELTWELSMTFEEDFVKDTYDAEKAVMKMAENSRFPTKEKSQIGFIVEDHQVMVSGIIGRDIPVLDKIGQIAALDISPTLKEMAIALLARSRKTEAMDKKGRYVHTY